MTMMDAAGMAALQGAVPVGLSASAMPGPQNKKRYPAKNYAPRMTGNGNPAHSNRTRAKQIATNNALTGDTSGGSY